MNSLLGKPVFWLMVAVILVAALLAANDAVSAADRRADAREREADDVAMMAAEWTQLRDRARELEQSLGAGEPVLQTIQRLSAAENLTMASTQSAGADNVGEFRDVLTSVRFQGVALGPLRRLLQALESSRSGLLVKEMTIRKSVGRSDRLDVEIVVGNLEKSS
jgi:hypothetical protein